MRRTLVSSLSRWIAVPHSLVAMIACLGVFGLAGSAGAEGPKVQHSGDQLPAHRIADPKAAVIDAGNLVESERFWPYLVVLESEYEPEGAQRPLRAGSKGVLVRVLESGERARIDFGRDGIHEVPIAATNLVAAANAVRLGETKKNAPNFTWAMGARILDARLDSPKVYGMENAMQRPGFLTVFVDPGDREVFDAMARAIGPLNDRHGVLTIVLSQGRAKDGELLMRHKEASWEVAYVVSHLSRAYTRSLLTDGAASPYLMLQTAEGRVLAEGAWSPEIADTMRQAIDEAFGADDRRAATSP